MYDNRSELIKAIVNEIRNPVNEIIKDNHRYIIKSHSAAGIKSVEIADFAGHYCIIIRYTAVTVEESHTVEKGISTMTGRYFWQGIAVTPRSPAYKKFKDILESVYAERYNKKIA